MGYGNTGDRVLHPNVLVLAVGVLLVTNICLAQLDFIWDVGKYLIRM